MRSKTLLSKAVTEFKPPVRQLVSEWASDNFELPETSAEPGKYNLDRAAYQVGILDSICEPGVQKVSLMCSAQIGKTIILLIIICYLIDLDPCSMLLTQPTSQMAEIFSKEKLNSAITNVKPINKKIILKSRTATSTILMKMFAGGFLRLAGANSPSSLASMSIRAYFGDEIDKYPPSAGKEGDPVKLAAQRTETFWNWMIFLVSTPSIKGNSRIDDEFQESDKRRFFVPCPHCDHKQHLVWERFKYHDRGRDSADPARGVYYECQNCKKPIGEEYKAYMIRNGEWRATAQAKDPKHIGFHLNRFYSPWKSWVDLCLDFESSRKDPQKLQVFYNATLGLPFEHLAGEKIDWEKIKKRGDRSDYVQGYCPIECLILTAGVDVQEDRLEVAVWGWGRGEQAWVIRYERIIGDPLKSKVWNQLYNVITKNYPHAGGSTLRVRATCVDTGYLTKEVYNQIRKFKSSHYFAIKGYSGDRPIISAPTLQQVNYKGKKIKRGIKLFKVGVDYAKESIYSRSQIDTPGHKYINFPNNLDSNWYEGLFSEVQVTKLRNGRSYIAWEVLPGLRNEVLDTAVYALAGAEIAGISRMNWDALEAEVIPDPPSEDLNSTDLSADNSKITSGSQSRTRKSNARKRTRKRNRS